MKRVIIQNKIFELFPTFCRGVIIVKSIDNDLVRKPIEELLNAQTRKWCAVDLESNDFISSWDDVHRKFGSNPNKYPPSIKSLIKRVNKGSAIPYINSVVALFNCISLKHLLPCGGDDIERIHGNLVLGFSKGIEKFVSLGGSEVETPEEGEVIYYDDQSLDVMCRRWNWRNGDFSKITQQSKQLVINIDGVGKIPKTKVEEATKELANLLSSYCNAQLSTSFLSIDNQSMEF